MFSSWYNHNCTIRQSGEIYCWGNNGSGQSTPPEGTYVYVDHGTNSSCAINTNGALECWGFDSNWKSSNYGQVSSSVSRFVSVSVGGYFACAVDMNVDIECCGYHRSYGQVNNDPSNGTFTKVYSGLSHSCGLDVFRVDTCWGRDTNGKIDPPTVQFISISIGDNSTYGIDIDGGLHCWGQNDFNKVKDDFDGAESLTDFTDNDANPKVGYADCPGLSCRHILN